MKLGIIGYGRMGKAIEKVAVQKGHTIAWIIDTENQADLLSGNIGEADVAIEFTLPAFAEKNITACLRAGIPIVSGTTGWIERLADVQKLCIDKDGAFVYASNFSVGVNLFFELNEFLARLMSGYPEYKPELEEIHHIHKLDSPSGTGITLANGLLSYNPRLQKWVEGHSSTEGDLPIISKRFNLTPGTHTVKYDSHIDAIEIKHTAYGREGFATGALYAAEWLQEGRKGCFSMRDVLGLNKKTS